MSTISAATVLVIDDEPSDSSFEVGLRSIGVDARVLGPDDVMRNDVEWADLVLVDFQLDKWQTMKSAQFSLQPPDGLALAALLRRQVHDARQSSPTAFAVRTMHLDKLASPLPSEARLHVLARMNNLEWVFDKRAPFDEVGTQIKALAESVRLLPENWPVDNATEAVTTACELLHLDTEIEPDSWSEVAACLPPLHSMSRWSHGLAFIRWFLHRILPYPCFLLCTNYLAARLRITRPAVIELMKAPKNPFSSCGYTGILSAFIGPRWWRSRVERVIWQGTKGDTLSADVIRGWLKESTGLSLEPSATDDYPVVCLDENERQIQNVLPMDKCVRIRPDDWPAFAEPAWTSIELAKSHAALASLVLADDEIRTR
jgi:hypothetical protein